LSELLRVGSLKTVDHGAASVVTLKELVRRDAVTLEMMRQLGCSAEPRRNSFTSKLGGTLLHTV
jgi:hypothetical protein